MTSCAKSLQAFLSIFLIEFWSEMPLICTASCKTKSGQNRSLGLKLAASLTSGFRICTELDFNVATDCTDTKIVGQSCLVLRVVTLEHYATYSFLNTGSPPSFKYIPLSSLLTLSSPLNKHSTVSVEFKSWENPSLARISLLE